MDTNSQIAHLFSEIASMLEIQNVNPFKIRAYKNAADSIGALESDISEIASDAQKLSAIKGIGKEISSKIAEFVDTGEIEYHKRLRCEVGAEVLEMLNLRGVGPKIVRVLSDAGIKNIDELKRRIDGDGLTGIKGIGKKKADAISGAIDFYRLNASVYGLGEALAQAEILCGEISELEGVLKVLPVGGLRRMRETVSEIELLVSLKDGRRLSGASSFFKNLSNLRHLESPGEFDDSKAIAKTTSGIKTVIHATRPQKFISDLVRLTGSQSHWKKLPHEGKTRNNPQSEREFYSGLGFPFIPPELREDSGEIEAAANGSLPRTVELSDIRGDLHTHTNWSDGRDCIERMAAAALEAGYEYLGLTDHSPSSTVANGLSIERLASKTEEVKRVNSVMDGIEILAGTEVDIKPDGSLDYPDDILAELDFVIASVHSSFSLDSDLMTARIVRALENRFVHALGHPTARIIGRRAPCRMDMEKIMDTAVKYGKALEINSSCHRLDLKDEHVRMAVEKGVKLIISTDAHSCGQLSSMVCGVAVARRGWACAADFLNTLPLRNLLDRLKADRRK